MMLSVLHLFQYLPEHKNLYMHMLLRQITVENISRFPEILRNLIPVSNSGNTGHRIQIPDLCGIVTHYDHISSARILSKHRTSLADVLEDVIQRTADEIQGILSAVFRQKLHHRCRLRINAVRGNALSVDPGDH